MSKLSQKAKKNLLTYGAFALVSIGSAFYAFQNDHNSAPTNYNTRPNLLQPAHSQRTPTIEFSLTSPPKDNLDIVQYRANLQKHVDELNAKKLYDAKLEAIKTVETEKEERLLVAKTQALKTVQAEQTAERMNSKPAPQPIDSYTRTLLAHSQPTQPTVKAEPYSGTGKSKPNLSRKPNAFQRFYNSVFLNNSPKVVRAIPAPGYEAHNAKLNALEQTAKNTPTARLTTPSKPEPVLDAYQLEQLKEAEIAKAERDSLRECEEAYLVHASREMNERGIPYVGSDKVQDYKPGQRLSIPVKEITPSMPKEQEINQSRINVKAPGFSDKRPTKLPDRTGKKTQRGILEHYADYSTGLIDLSVGSDTSKGNMDNAGRAFKESLQDFVDGFTASSLNPERKPIGHNHSSADFVSYFKNGGKSIWDTVNPDSEVYNSAGIPARIIGCPTAIVALALGTPFELLSLGSANISDRTLEQLVFELPDDFAEGLAQTANAPGNLVTKKGFGYHFRRAYSIILRFAKNVFTGKGFKNSLNAKKAFAQKGKLASLEEAVGTAALGASAAGVTFLGSDSGGFDVFNPVAPVTPGAGISGGRSRAIGGGNP